MDSFTPLSALAGGALIGLAAVVLMALNGRIAGISGILGGLVGPDRAWRIAFLAGLLGGPLAVQFLSGWSPDIEIAASLPEIILAGLLVGFGTRLGSGCTSGHGVCGLARLSPRSLVATGTFMAAGVAVVFLLRHVIGG